MRGVRMLGVSVSMLLYHPKPRNFLAGRRDRVTEAVDALNEKYGRDALTRATLLPGLPGGDADADRAGWHPTENAISSAA